MASLEKYLKGEPLSDELARLMDGSEESEPETEPEPEGRVNIFHKRAITDDDREHIRRLMTEPGWQVLLWLLDSDIARLEDAAKRVSMDEPLSVDGKTWADVAYLKRSRFRIVELAEQEVRKMKAKKK